MSQRNRTLNIEDLPRQQEELTATEAEEAKGGLLDTVLDGLITMRHELWRNFAEFLRG
jgi:hypothetical protein